MGFARWLGAGLFIVSMAACSSPSGPSTDDREADDQAGVPATVAQGDRPLVADKARTIALDTQGVAAIGLTVRVKGIELGTDATILNVSASYGGTETNNVPLASDPTYLLDEQGNKLMLKPPSENPRLNILRGQQMDGQLVFLGAAPRDAKRLTLVFNNNNPGDSVIAPGLSIPLELDRGAR